MDAIEKEQKRLGDMLSELETRPPVEKAELGQALEILLEVIKTSLAKGQRDQFSSGVQKLKVMSQSLGKEDPNSLPRLVMSAGSKFLQDQLTQK
jgi:hypothetical protein